MFSPLFTASYKKTCLSCTLSTLKKEKLPGGGFEAIT